MNVQANVCYPQLKRDGELRQALADVRDWSDLHGLAIPLALRVQIARELGLWIPANWRERVAEANRAPTTTTRLQMRRESTRESYHAYVSGLFEAQSRVVLRGIESGLTAEQAVRTLEHRQIAQAIQSGFRRATNRPFYSADDLHRFGIER